ncbi:MAG: beta-propeller fold lactonase family protein, partial [Planctomycetota bacterium]
VVADETQQLLHRLQINLSSSDTVPDGSLVSIGQTPITVVPRGLRFSADGRTLFVSIDNPTDPDNLVVYDFDPANGSLTFVDAETPASQPRGLATRDRVQ